MDRLGVWSAPHGLIVLPGFIGGGTFGGRPGEQSQHRPKMRGPGAGTGVWMEPFEDRLYLRKRCKCGDDQKWGKAKLATLPVRQERGRWVVYL